LVQLLRNIRGQLVPVPLAFLSIRETPRPDADLEAPRGKRVVDRVLGLRGTEVQDVAVRVNRGELPGQHQQDLPLADSQAVLRRLNVVGNQQVSTTALQVPSDTD